MATVYLIIPLLLLGVVLAAVWLDRWSVPVILIALGAGIVAGSDVLGFWYFDNVEAANDLANAALVFILFHGGLATKRADFKAVALPAGGMATWGVVLTASITFSFIHFILAWEVAKSLLLAVIISSTDAAATFSILRRQSLPSKLSSTIEIESAANDPMAILLTLVVVEGLSSGSSGGFLIVPLFLWKFLAGPLIGWLMARVALAIFNRLSPQDRGYYYVLLIAVVLMTYGASEYAQASGMLAVFTAGFVMGNRHFIYKQGVRNFSAALSMISNIGVFVMMGLLVFPRQWSALWLEGLILFLVLTFIARPCAVWIGTIGMKLGICERQFMCWAGLRGAVPIVLATYPMAAGLQLGEEVFNLVFFAVLLSILTQGSTLGALARHLGLSEPARPQPRYGLELVAMSRSDLDLFVVDLPGPHGRPGPRIRELALPPRALITLITRDSEVIPPTGLTRLLGWDQVTVLARIVDQEAVHSALVQPFNRIAETEENTTRVLDFEPTMTPPGTVPHSAAKRKSVVLLGYGRVGTVLAGFLLQRNLPFIVIEQDLTTVERLRREGVSVVHGEGDQPTVLESAGIAAARLLLITSSEPTTVRRAIEYAYQVNPSIEIITRVHQPSEFNLLRTFPQTQCVLGEVEIAHAMARLMLIASGISVIETEAMLMDARRDRSGLDTPATRIIEIHVPPTSPVLGKKLPELGLPHGAGLIGISRNGEFFVPNDQTEIFPDDSLLVLADAKTAREIERLLLLPDPQVS